MSSLNCTPPPVCIYSIHLLSASTAVNDKCLEFRSEAISYNTGSGSENERFSGSKIKFAIFVRLKIGDFVFMLQFSDIVFGSAPHPKMGVRFRMRVQFEKSIEDVT